MTTQSAAARPGQPTLLLENFRCFERAEVPLDAQVTVILGANGSGKTSIAEALASLAPGEGEGLSKLPVRRGATEGSIRLLSGARSVARWQVGPGRDERVRLPSSQRLFIYGQYRALRPPPDRERPAARASWLETAEARPLPSALEEVARRPATGTLFDFDEYLFRDLAAYVALLAERGAYDPIAAQAWEALRDWLRKLDEQLGDVTIREHKGRRAAVFERAGTLLDITELSDGYRSVLAVVLDLVLRYTQLYTGAGSPLELEALVVIDEIDLNLHPRWQRRIIEQLTSLFPGTRFVLTTHSPAVVQAAIDERHQILKLDEKHGAPTAVRPFTKADLARLDGAEVDSVLVDRAAFNTGSRYSRKYQKLEEEAAELRRKLQKEEATPRDERRFLKLLDTLRLLAVKEETRSAKGPALSEIALAHKALLESLMKERRKTKGATRRG